MRDRRWVLYETSDATFTALSWALDIVKREDLRRSLPTVAWWEEALWFRKEYPERFAVLLAKVRLGLDPGEDR